MKAFFNERIMFYNEWPGCQGTENNDQEQSCISHCKRYLRNPDSGMFTNRPGHDHLKIIDPVSEKDNTCNGSQPVHLLFRLKFHQTKKWYDKIQSQVQPEQEFKIFSSLNEITGFLPQLS